ncbi:phosphoethanolamine transferase [Candidatus Bandiella euplotis]|uniref:Phosphoethanolamine transferase EptA n=1 Tax=Candidatus Bandiella euplotis TaxID=1664265 RepID=A0ABZ0UR26_9RICK|nr:phosphoethanolamine--lipid A transferase [Candidatus Bandiella woodruffii]WPX97365.1 Phosphoethanolamine transferase EptA [Candidatus Bandiella woodruffii]
MREKFLTKLNIQLPVFNLLMALYTAVFLNIPLFIFLLNLSPVGDGFLPMYFLAVFLLVLICFLYIGFSCISIPFIHKPIVILILLTASLAQYFMLKYGIVVDSFMVENVLETDFKESRELLTSNLVFIFFITGLLPTILVCRSNIVYPNKVLTFLKCLSGVIVCAGLMLLLIFFQFKTFASIFRNHKDIVHRIIPNNFVNAIYQNLKLIYPAEKPIDFIPSEAVKDKRWSIHKRPSIFVFVVGETARAENFSLNGYKRETNPKLKALDIINYENVSACGTSTAASVPCIFSSFDRANFTKGNLKHSDNLLNLIKSSDFQVLWIDNNSGCKEVCDGSTTIHTDKWLRNKYDKEIYDESMLEILEDYISHNKGQDLFVVLHQKGSHGPAYYIRTPESFYQFTPICKTTELQQCSPESIVNSYDNTILYTDYFLAKLIAFLKDKKDVNTAMLYVSDHGESLGENGIYLHGMPYMIAPKNQKHVPMIMWLSDNYLDDFKIHKNCLSLKKEDNFSHDNLFHSILDALQIKTKVLDKKLSIFYGCISR